MSYVILREFSGPLKKLWQRLIKGLLCAAVLFT